MSTLRVSKIFNDSRLTLIAVESVDLLKSKANTGYLLYGHIEPIAVIVSSPDGIYALDMNAQPANVDQLKRDVPDLDAYLRD